MEFWIKFAFRWQLLAFGIISVFIGFTINTHLDEFIIFADLAYRNPNFYLNQFPNGYQAYVKLFPFGFYANLPYPYVGNVQSFLFLPFYLFLPIELAKFCYSFISLVVIAYFFISEFKLKGVSLWILALFLPLYITVLHDSGPVNISIITFFLSKRLVERNFKKESVLDLFINCLLLFMLWSLAFFDKHFFLYLFPGILVFSIANIQLQKFFTLKSVFIFISVILFLGFVAFYLNGEIQVKSYEGEKLVSKIVSTKLMLGSSPDVILLAKFILHFPESIHYWSNLDQFFQERLMTFATYLNSFDFSFYLIRNLNLKDFIFFSLGSNFPISVFLFFTAFIFLLFRYLIKVAKRGVYPNEYKTIVYFVSFFTLSLTFLVLGKVRSPHHFIYIWIPLFGMFFDSHFRPNFIYLFIPYFVITASTTTFNLLLSDPEDHIVDDYQSIVSFTRRDDPQMQIINFDSWSHSFTRMIDNPNHHLVTWIDLRDERQLNRLIYLSDSLMRPIIEVSSRLDWGHEANPLSAKERMELFERKGLKVKQINQSKNLPIFMIQR